MTPHDLTKAKLEIIDLQLHTRFWKSFRLSYSTHNVLIQFN